MDLRESELTVHESSGFDGSANRAFLGLSFYFAQQPILPKCLWVRTYLTLVLHQLVSHQFEPLDLRESELMVLQWRGFYRGGNMPFFDSVFISLDNPFYPNASGWARTLL